MKSHNLPRNESSSARAYEAPVGLLVIALGILAVLTWFGGPDLMFAFSARRAQAEIAGWSVQLVPWGTSGGPNVPWQTGVAPVPKLGLRLLPPLSGSCEAIGRLAVFGLRELESKQQMSDVLASLQAQGPVQVWVRERGGKRDCRLSRAMSPAFSTLWASIALVSSAVLISMWRGRRHATVHAGDSHES